MKFYVFFLFVHAMGSSLDYAAIEFFHTGVPVFHCIDNSC